MNTLDAALAYAAKGIPVFPVGKGKEGKAPFTQNGFHDASTDPEKIKAWWTQHPSAKIGMPCGRASKLLVVDIDCHPGKPSGFDSIPNWAELSDHVVKTAGGGRHLYFADDGKTAIAHPFPGVEVRGEGHYVILPGPYGYELERQGTIKPVPEFLLANGRTSTGKTRSRRLREKPISPSLLKLCEGHRGKGTSTDKDDLPDFELIVQRINLIPNPDLPWGEWKRFIMAVWAAFRGNADGLAAAHAWSRKSNKYDAEGTDRAWAEVTGSPPSDLSAGTLIWSADQAAPGWRDGEAEIDAREVESEADTASESEPEADPEPEAKAEKSSTADETNPEAESDDPEPNTKAEGPSTTGLCWIETSLTFTSSFTPPDYLIDEVLQRRFLYSMTAPTGGGKTSVSLSMAAHLDLGRALGGHEVEKCKVLFLAGENPDDVCMRWIKLCEELELDHSQVGVHFLPHVLSLTDRNTLARIKSESLAAGPFGAVFVDTSAAYNEAEEENDNVQMGKHARALRNLIQVIDGGPTIIATTHPTKNANMDNLLPRGGGAFLAEVDGNLVCQKVPDSMAVDLHWHGKFRGPDFSPIPFELRAGTTNKLKTSKGKLIWTVTAMPITPEQRTVLDDGAARDQDEVLAYMLDNPSASFGEIATGVGWFQRDGLPYKMKVQRVIKGMVPAKLVEKAGRGDRWALTKKGKTEADDAKARLAVM